MKRYRSSGAFGAIVFLFIVAALWGVGEPALALALFALGAIVFLQRQARLRRARDAGRADAMIAAARAFVAKIDADRCLPSLPPLNLNLGADEFVVMREARCRVFGLREPCGAPPDSPYLRFAGFSIYDDLRRSSRGVPRHVSAAGSLCLTNRRLVFVGERANLEIALAEMLAIEPALDSFRVAVAGADNSRRFTAENPLLWGLMIRWLSATPVAEPGLPAGAALRLVADAAGIRRNVAISLTLPE